MFSLFNVCPVSVGGLQVGIHPVGGTIIAKANWHSLPQTRTMSIDRLLSITSERHAA